MTRPPKREIMSGGGINGGGGEDGGGTGLGGARGGRSGRGLGGFGGGGKVGGEGSVQPVLQRISGACSPVGSASIGPGSARKVKEPPPPWMTKSPNWSWPWSGSSLSPSVNSTQSKPDACGDQDRRRISAGALSTAAALRPR